MNGMAIRSNKQKNQCYREFNYTTVPRNEIVKSLYMYVRLWKRNINLNYCIHRLFFVSSSVSKFGGVVSTNFPATGTLATYNEKIIKV